MKRSTKQNDDENEYEVLLETSEQEKIISNLRQEAIQNSLQLRRAFSIVYCLLGLCFIYCLAKFIYDPWESIHQLRFKNSVPESYFCLYYIFTIYSFFRGATVIQVC